MPLYCYQCKQCGEEKEEVHSVADRTNAGACHCGGSFGIIICPVKTIGYVFTFTPHYDYRLGKYFGTAEAKKQHLAKEGLSQTNGQFSPTVSSRDKMQVPATPEQGRLIDEGKLNPYQDANRKITVGK